ncbi:neurogenic locus notch [Legionella hackeliae]|nr:neurogenic locus notch [Legionella hackeliae]
MGGISYCDTSAGRYVCSNGYYSSCYCTRHAVMDLQKLQGCCLWQGGVLTVDDATGVVVCNNGGVSEVCSLQSPSQQVSIW